MRFFGETPAELPFLKVADDFFSERYILREEVVEIIRDKGVVDAASVTQCG